MFLTAMFLTAMFVTIVFPKPVLKSRPRLSLQPVLAFEDDVENQGENDDDQH
jgi:hypothetical protein